MQPTVKWLIVGCICMIQLPSRIIAKIEGLFTQADIIEQAAAMSLRSEKQVYQSILARAFRGELV